VILLDLRSSFASGNIAKNSKKLENMKTITFILQLKWYANDCGGDKRPITIDYINISDLETQKQNIKRDFKTKPLNIDFCGKNYLGEIPFSVAFL